MKFEFDTLPDDHAEVIDHHSRSFSLAARFLPKAIRSDVKLLYAWCRWCDDAVDNAANPADAANRIEMLRDDIQRIYSGQPLQHAASQWFADIAGKYSIPIQYPMDLLDGMATDVGNPVLETEDELLTYCYQAAGTVGLMMCRIMGVHDSIALDKAKALGIAMQLTNIARDVNEDWQRGRRYIPKRWLSVIPKKDMSPTNQQVRPAVEKVLNLADKFYTRGFQGLQYLPAAARPAIHLAGKVYREIGNEIRRSNFEVMSRRMFVSNQRKLVVVSGCALSEVSSGFSRACRIAFRKINFASSFPFISTNSFFDHGSPMKQHETRYLGFLGLSLTFVMATTLFFLMGLNPKASSYEMLPWIYTGACALIASVTGLIARHYNQEMKLQPVSKGDSAR